MFRTVQAKLFAGTGLVLLGFIALSLTSINVLTTRYANAGVARELDAARVASRRYVALRHDGLRSRARAVAQIPYLKATLTIDGLDRATAFAAMGQLSDVAETPLLLVLDARGQLLADAADRDAPPIDLQLAPAVVQALEGEDADATWSYRGQVYLVATSPAIVGDAVAGIVVVGIAADAGLAAELRDIVGADVFLVHEERVIGRTRDAASSLGADDEVARLVVELTAQHPPSAVERAATAPWNDEQRVIAVPLNDGVTLVLTRTLGDLLLLHRQQRLWLLGASLVSAMIALLASRIVATRLCRPIAGLTRASEAFGSGDLTVSVPEEGGDELSTLSAGFNRMTERIARLMAESRGHLTALQAQQDQLERARDEAEAASRAKSAFLANMSHELRTPLNAIIGYSELLIDEADPSRNETMTADLRRILSSARHLLSVVTDILDLSKVEAGRESLDTETFDLPTLLRQTLALVEPLAAKNGNVLGLVLDTTITEITTDGRKLRQVLFNLLSNACKFTTDGTITVQLTSHNVDGGYDLTMCVADTGIGVPPERLDAIFDPFTQADDSTTRRYGGTGLGLAISRSYCHLMGGTLSAVSEPGRGSMFTATIRVQETVGAESAA